MSLYRTSLFTSMLMSSALMAGCHWHSSNYSCYYDFWGNYVCTYYNYASDGSVESSRDIITDVANAQEQHVAVIAEHYVQKFNLSDEQGMKLAQSTVDFNLLENRTEQDMADFARRLYGVDPSEIVAAVGSAQAGDRTKLNKLVDEAAANFGTTPETMKNIVRAFHAKALAEQGVSL